MKKILMVLVAVASMGIVAYGEEGADTDGAAKKGKLQAVKKEFAKVKKAALKELKDDEQFKEMTERLKALQKEINDYISEKNPAYAEAYCKYKEGMEKFKAQRKKREKKPKKDGEKKKKKKKEDVAE